MLSLLSVMPKGKIALICVSTNCTVDNVNVILVNVHLHFVLRALPPCFDEHAHGACFI